MRNGVDENDAEEAVRTLIRYIGDDPSREGLEGTPARFLKAWREDWGAGYATLSADNLIQQFDQDFSRLTPANAMVLVSGINFASTCEHHLAPFFGTATIGYIPDGRGKLGLSKFARIVDHFARCLSIQERLTDNIANFLRLLVADDVAVLMRATHTCMVTRGVRQPGAITTTAALRGEFETNDALRSEFYAATRA